jgi:hypothetical protein
MTPRIERVSITPTRLLDALERARQALVHGDQQTARREVEYAVDRLQSVRAAQNVALDEAAQTPEAPAPRVVLPQGGEAAEA